MSVELVTPNPFFKNPDYGEVKVFGDVSDSINFTYDDIEEIVCQGSTDGNDWDGEVAAVVKLRDGRYVAWETFWGPTGDGFSEDAYGGDADIVIAATAEDAIRFGLTNNGRRLCGLPKASDDKTDGTAVSTGADS